MNLTNSENIKKIRNTNKAVGDKKIIESLKKRKKNKLGFFILINSFYRKYPFLFTGLIFLIIINSIFTAAIAYFTNIIIQQSIYDVDNNSGSDWGLAWYFWVLITFSILILMCIGTFFRDYIGNMISIKIEVDLRNILVSKLLEQDISYYSDKKIGEIMTKLISDTNIIGNEINGLFVSVISAPLVLLFGTISLMLINPIIGAISVGLVYLMALFLTLIVKNYRKRIGVIRDIITDINGDVVDKISSIKLIKSSGTRCHEKERIESIHKPYIMNFKPVAKTGGWLITILIISDVIVSVVTISAAIFIYGDKDPIYFTALITPFVAGLTSLTRPLWQISGIIPGISRASTSTQRIFDIIRSESLLSENLDEGFKLEDTIESIVFEGVSFAYPEKTEKLILPPINLNFEKGKSYAFVGETGSGKSTISKLMLRFYDPTIGCIKINGHNLKELNLNSYLQHLGYVEQDPQILYGTVYENIKYGIFNVSDAEVIEACKKAGLHKLIESWPCGYETILGERGTLISGGQKQRIVIARIILKNPDLLILDEATSALDNIVETEIQKELETIMVNKTTIIIAHRLSTIKNVDQIFVLGKNAQGIIQQGTFAELVNIDGHFKDLYIAGEIKNLKNDLD